MLHKAIAATAACALLAGCATNTLQSQSVRSNALGYYSLPRAEMGVQVYYAQAAGTDGLMVAAETPRITSGESIPLGALFSAASEDRFEVKVDPATGFLQQISLNLEDRSVETARALAASIGAVYAFNPGFLAPRADTAESLVEPPRRVAPILVATTILDPTSQVEVEKANLTLWSQTLDSLRWRQAIDCARDARGGDDEAAVEGSTCQGGPTLAALVPAGKVPVDTKALAAALARDRPFILLPETATAPRSNQCDFSQNGSGVCVRVAKAWRLALQAPGGPILWQGAHLPVAGDEYLLNVERAMFATKTYKVDFEHGFAGDRSISQTSQALAVAGAPKVVVDAFIDSLGKTTQAISGIIPLRVEYRNLRYPEAKAETTATTSTQTTAAPAAGAATGAQSTQTTQTTASASSSGGATPPKPPTPAAPAAPAAAATAPAAAPAAPAKTDPAPKPERPAPPAPQLWFAACTIGLSCEGALQKALLGEDENDAGDAGGGDGQELPQPEVSAAAGRSR
ncbi:MAG: hypothetical protein Q8N19_05505 [Phenylobacterium sp.]|uniref:hypothetical protein n=1 Tax=Phenylobacterium sp. TaxID=1871053 RepID=UPI002733DE83|nr:hypothetical protein [Phenylobacterium sp.]MDP3116556.1 hypothetical protein [Phenylobacterium sp.]